MILPELMLDGHPGSDFNGLLETDHNVQMQKKSKGGRAKRPDVTVISFIFRKKNSVIYFIYKIVSYFHFYKNIFFSCQLGQSTHRHLLEPPLCKMYNCILIEIIRII